MSYGSTSKPVSLDPFQNIVEVKWKTQQNTYPWKNWRVDYSYLAGAWNAGIFYTINDVRDLDPTDPLYQQDPLLANWDSTFRSKAEQTLEGRFTVQYLGAGAISTAKTVTRTGKYVRFVGIPILDPDESLWIGYTKYDYKFYRLDASRPPFDGVLTSNSKTFTTKTQQEENNLSATIEAWWASRSAELIASGYTQPTKGSPYRI